ncbi:hypothetical protein A3K86_20985 [Photobacterium jeanii]|uniref:Uncharacterized protein n=1 Tax=Photobacterium jeanii TaxID=858640 RepID=A0A178K3W9_9GAMM|nr:hypothetical protein [Photobacterium jeanii]OAN11422.1 hypothetical protein A3K86_20985 [Photobacterium jeanii]PST90942.1 hypothetical protein C9I91_10090 [Photobacterium jeanii]
MLAECRHVALVGDKARFADIKIAASGVIEVDIPEDHRHFEADFEQLHFHTEHQKTELVCHSVKADANKVEWKLELGNDDATALLKLIERASDEYETLMRDL